VPAEPSGADALARLNQAVVAAEKEARPAPPTGPAALRALVHQACGAPWQAAEERAEGGARKGPAPS
jgi:hypothetical protein